MSPNVRAGPINCLRSFFFVFDIVLLHQNSIRFNGDNHIVTKRAEELVRSVQKILQKQTEKFGAFESAIINEKAEFLSFFGKKMEVIDIPDK